MRASGGLSEAAIRVCLAAAYFVRIEKRYYVLLGNFFSSRLVCGFKVLEKKIKILALV